MAAYFIDLDGTVFYFGTNTFLPNAADNLRRLAGDGNQVIFTTLRDAQGADEARQALESEGLGRCPIITGVESPRIVINDEGAKAVNHPRNAPWPAI